MLGRPPTPRTLGPGVAGFNLEAHRHRHTCPPRGARGPEVEHGGPAKLRVMEPGGPQHLSLHWDLGPVEPRRQGPRGSGRGLRPRDRPEGLGVCMEGSGPGDSVARAQSHCRAQAGSLRGMERPPEEAAGPAGPGSEQPLGWGLQWSDHRREVILCSGQQACGRPAAWCQVTGTRVPGGFWLLSLGPPLTLAVLGSHILRRPAEHDHDGASGPGVSCKCRF